MKIKPIVKDEQLFLDKIKNVQPLTEVEKCSTLCSPISCSSVGSCSTTCSPICGVCPTF